MLFISLSEITCQYKIDKSPDFKAFSNLLEDEFNIDEAQQSTGLESFVRSMKENGSRARVILTGTSMSRLFPLA